MYDEREEVQGYVGLHERAGSPVLRERQEGQKGKKPRQCMKPKVGARGRSRSPRMELAGRRVHSGVEGRRSS